MKLAAIVHVEDDSSWLAIIDTDLLPGYLSVIFEDAPPPSKTPPKAEIAPCQKP